LPQQPEGSPWDDAKENYSRHNDKYGILEQACEVEVLRGDRAEAVVDIAHLA
jgi:hypothetical protein